MKVKEFIYEAPQVEVMEVEIEQILCSSGENGEWGDGNM